MTQALESKPKAAEPKGAHRTPEPAPHVAPSSSLPLQTLLYLQTFAGNAAVAEMLGAATEKRDLPQPQEPLSPSAGSTAPPAAANGAALAGPATGPAEATAPNAVGFLGEVAGVAVPIVGAVSSPLTGIFGSLLGPAAAPAPAQANGQAPAQPQVPDQKAPVGKGPAEQPAAPSPATVEGAAPAEAPQTPESDPNFVAAKGRVHDRARQTAHHPPASTKVAEAQSAAQGPPNEVASQAGAAQVGKMAGQQPGGFDKAAFMEAVRKAIDAAAPTTLAEADDFKDSGKAGQVKNQVSGLVGQNKASAEKDIKGATQAPPDTSAAQPKPVTPMPAEEAGVPPPAVGAASAMPTPKPAEESNLAKGPADVNASMKEADVTEQQIKESNEPEFTGALEAKGEAEKHSAEAPKEFQQQEKAILDKGRSSATGVADQGLQAMHGQKVKALSGVASGKTDAKSQDEARRAEVSSKIEGIYGKTKDEVTAILNGIDGQVDTAFKDGEERARAGFESYVDVRMTAFKDDRYSGWTGGLKWGKDKLFGMPDEVNEFYVKGRALYLQRMEGVISNVADIVGRELLSARDRIALGKTQISEYVASLPTDLRKVGMEAQQNIQSKFDELTQAVDAKQEDVVNNLAKKYVESRDAVDAHIKEMKEANKGLVDKAIGAIKGVIETILKLKDMLLNVLAKAAGVIGSIIGAPIKFLGNLVGGLKQGLSQFMSNIGEHLKKGLLGWLFGALGEAGLTLPEKFDLKGILHIIMQILGLTYSHIRGLAVGIVGEEVVTHLEKSLGFFQVLIKEGPAGLWKWIVEKLSELKATVMDKIKEFIQEKVIIAGIMWLIGLLNPVAAFIKACKAIYDIVKFFIERAGQVMELVNAILDSVGAIAGGALGEAAGKVEDALGKAIPVAIGFLASLLGLGGISDKIRSIIQAIQEPIHNVISKVLGVVLKPFKWIGNKIKQGAAWAKKKLEQGVTYVKTKAKQGVAFVKGKVFGKDEGTPAGMAVKAKAHKELQKHTGKPFASFDQLKATVQTVLEKLRPEGLKQLRVTQQGAGQYDIVAVASPAETVDHAVVVTKAPNIQYARDGKGRPALSSGGPLVNKSEDRVKGEEAEALDFLRGVLPIGQGGYEAGHLIADRFGGSSETKNLVPLAFKTNHSWMGVFETYVAGTIREGKHGDIYASVRPVYPDGLVEQVPAQGRDDSGNVEAHVLSYIEILERIPDQLVYTIEGEKDGARTIIKSEPFSAEDRGNLPKATEAARAAGHKRARDLYQSNEPAAIVKAKARAELGTFLSKPVKTLQQLQGIAQQILGRLSKEGLKKLTVVPGKSPGKYEILAEASPAEMVAEATVLDEETGGGKAAPLTGTQVDEYMDASPFLKSYVEAKVKGGIKAEGHVHIHNDAAFVAAYVKMAVTRQNPTTGKVFTPDEAKARAPMINGFREGTEIHLHEHRAQTTTTIHETMHLYQDDAGYVRTVGKYAMEGTAEYFTHVLCAEQKLSRSGFYESELSSVGKLAGVAGREKLAAAFFKGSVAELEAAIDSKGKGTFAKWCGFMKAQLFEKADDLLK